MFDARSSRSRAFARGAIGITVLIALLAVAYRAQQARAQYISPGACAEHEPTLATLVGAPGAPPNAAASVLDDEAHALMSARTLCNNGKISAVLATYDQLIGALTATPQRRK